MLLLSNEQYTRLIQYITPEKAAKLQITILELPILNDSQMDLIITILTGAADGGALGWEAHNQEMHVLQAKLGEIAMISAGVETALTKRDKILGILSTWAPGLLKDINTSVVSEMGCGLQVSQLLQHVMPQALIQKIENMRTFFHAITDVFVSQQNTLSGSSIYRSPMPLFSRPIHPEDDSKLMRVFDQRFGIEGRRLG